MDFSTFITENSVLLIIIGSVIVLTVIGYIAQKTEFGKKVSAKNKAKEQENVNANEMQFEILDDNIDNMFVDSEKNIEEPIEQLDILDTVEPNFNNGNLMIGDVNENPDISNEELGIQEDLYAPFGEQQFSNNMIEDLKIEDVVEDDFVVLEKNKNEESEVVDSSILEPLSDTQVIPNVEGLQIEAVSEPLEVFDSVPKSDPIVDTINELVDNTFVINDATEDFETDTNEYVSQNNVDDLVDNINNANIDVNVENNINNNVNDNVINSVDNEATDNVDNNISDNVTDNDAAMNIVNTYEESKIKQFEIEDEDLHINEQPDYELEATTSLKLDEINEKIKNLKLEDLDNSNIEEEIVVPKKKNKKNKKVSVKSVDEIKKEKNIEEQIVIEEEIDLSAQTVDKNIVDDKNLDNEIDSALELPNLDEIVKAENENESVNEADDIWSF